MSRHAQAVPMNTPSADAVTRQAFRSDGLNYAVAELHRMSKKMAGDPEALHPYMASLIEFDRELREQEDEDKRISNMATRTRLIGTLMDMEGLTQRSNVKQMEADDSEVRRVMEQNQVLLDQAKEELASIESMPPTQVSN